MDFREQFVNHHSRKGKRSFPSTEAKDVCGRGRFFQAYFFAPIKSITAVAAAAAAAATTTTAAAAAAATTTATI